MRIPGLRRDRGDDVDAQFSSQIICPVCGLRNDSMARFCRNCGLPLGAPRDPVRGTTSRRADLPSEHGAGIAAIVGLLAAVVVLAGAGYLILRSNSSGTSVVPTRNPAASIEPGTTPEPTSALPSRVPGSVVPAISTPPGSIDPLATPPPTPPPSASPTATPSAVPLRADTGFTCDPVGFVDPWRRVWSIDEVQWGPRDRWDRMTFFLIRERGRGSTEVGVEGMDARTAVNASGMEEAPTDRVILLRFDGDISIDEGEVRSLSDLRALEYLDVQTLSDATYAVVGVGRDTCYRLSVPAWETDEEVAVGERVELYLDVRYR